MEAEQVQSQHQRETPERLGLALSGGGFRASFFHLGVLARLAETGLLRSVSVISTVSGGTIVGAYYYLFLKRLLETVAEPTDDDYRHVVHDIQISFLRSVRKNIRGRILLNPFKNYWMALSPKYSRSDRVGDLYDLYFYKHAWGNPGRRRFRRDKQIELRQLPITPEGYHGKGPFNPWRQNHELDAKVPILIMNATTLNTGHDWRFEAVRMGEPGPEDPNAKKLLAEIDVNERLEQAYFDGRKPAVPPNQMAFPLAKAVAASACVPLLFHPLSISHMYGGRRVQLVDGGVHDNQGVQALLDMVCDAVIVSDASGLMADRRRPAPFAAAVAGRAMSIYGARVRIEQLVRVDSELPTTLMHLLSDVPAGTVKPGERLEPGKQRDLTGYGINQTVQMRLAQLRTDLDAFSDAEAYSLMYSGYRMSAHALDRDGAGLANLVNPAVLDPEAWCFAPVAELAGSESPPTRYMRLLEAGRNLFFKSLIALPLVPRIVCALALAALLGAAVFGIVWGAVHGGFDLGPVSDWWWFGLVALIPALLPILALLQLAGGAVYLRLGSMERLAE